MIVSRQANKLLPDMPQSCVMEECAGEAPEGPGWEEVSLPWPPQQRSCPSPTHGQPFLPWGRPVATAGGGCSVPGTSWHSRSWQSSVPGADLSEGRAHVSVATCPKPSAHAVSQGAQSQAANGPQALHAKQPAQCMDRYMTVRHSRLVIAGGVTVVSSTTGGEEEVAAEGESGHS